MTHSAHIGSSAPATNDQPSLAPVDPASYNYADFPPAGDRGHFARFAEHLKVGTDAPDGELVLLGSAETGEATERVRLSDYWRDANLVVEFGSVT